MDAKMLPKLEAKLDAKLELKMAEHKIGARTEPKIESKTEAKIPPLPALPVNYEVGKSAPVAAAKLDAKLSETIKSGLVFPGMTSASGEPPPPPPPPPPLAKVSDLPEPVKPIRLVPPVKPILPLLNTTSGESASAPARNRPDSNRMSLDSIHSNPSTVDTTDSPRFIIHPAVHLNSDSAIRNGRPELNGHESVKTVPAPPPPPPPPPATASLLGIDVDPSANGGGASSGLVDPAAEKVNDFYPPNSFPPYSFTECWIKEIPENETKWQMYRRRMNEALFNCVACCIRCIGPV